MLLGTLGGPTIQGEKRLGISSALYHDGEVYVIDLGRGAFSQLGKADLMPKTAGKNISVLDNVRGVFLTHLHPDHTIDLPTMHVTASANGDGVTEPIQVYGPGDRGTLPRLSPEGAEKRRLVAENDPALGISAMTRTLDEAFAQDLNDRVQDSNTPRPSTLFDAHDIGFAGIWDVDAAGIPSWLDRPFDVWTDGEVYVTGTLVDHRRAAPTFASASMLPTAPSCSQETRGPARISSTWLRTLMCSSTR